MDKQSRLMNSEKDFVDQDVQSQMITDALRESNAQPDDPGKAMRLVDALEKTESLDQENRAMDILQKWFEKTKQFRFRQRIGAIQIKQLSRMERAKRAAVTNAPDNAELKKDYADFIKEKNEFELKEYQLAVEAYPTEMKLHYEVGLRLFNLQRYQEAIPVFQQVRNDPKYRTDAGLLLGRAFLEAGFPDEADETIAQLIRDYVAAGDVKSKEMYYWRGRALEQRGQKAEAITHYSKVAQWDFNYRDTQARIKKLRAAAT
jgi:TolA-binding protein